MSNKLKDLTGQIQALYHVTHAEIAEKIGYSRPYLTKAIKEDVGGKVIDKLKAAYPKAVQNITKEYIQPPIKEGQSLNQLIESNRLLASANKTMAETNKELAIMLKDGANSPGPLMEAQHRENDLMLEHLAEQGMQAGLFPSKEDGILILGRFLLSYGSKTALVSR